MPLHVIQNLKDPWIKVVKDDPVRPDIPVEFRVSDSTEIFVLIGDDEAAEAAVCVAYRCSVPANVIELAKSPELLPTVAVFYTIWSYKPGAGRKLILQSRKWMEQYRTNIVEFVTLSPPTEMARIFHLKNGAEVLRINPETVNYLYP